MPLVPLWACAAFSQSPRRGISRAGAQGNALREPTGRGECLVRGIARHVDLDRPSAAPLVARRRGRRPRRAVARAHPAAPRRPRAALVARRRRRVRRGRDPARGAAVVGPLAVARSSIAALVAAYAAASRVLFEVGAGFAIPTQLVLVPMLFAVPTGLVPLLVARRADRRRAAVEPPPRRAAGARDRRARERLARGRAGGRAARRGRGPGRLVALAGLRRGARGAVRLRLRERVGARVARARDLAARAPALRGLGLQRRPRARADRPARGVLDRPRRLRLRRDAAADRPARAVRAAARASGSTTRSSSDRPTAAPRSCSAT